VLLDGSRTIWSASVAQGAFPEAAKSEGDFMCVNNAKILFVENERGNTFLK
jgi:hypothetical protein